MRPDSYDENYATYTFSGIPKEVEYIAFYAGYTTTDNEIVIPLSNWGFVSSKTTTTIVLATVGGISGATLLGLAWLKRDKLKSLISKS